MLDVVEDDQSIGRQANGGKITQKSAFEMHIFRGIDEQKITSRQCSSKTMYYR